jgi:hypothetical protein
MSLPTILDEDEQESENEIKVILFENFLVSMKRLNYCLT